MLAVHVVVAVLVQTCRGRLGDWRLTLFWVWPTYRAITGPSCGNGVNAAVVSVTAFLNLDSETAGNRLEMAAALQMISCADWSRAGSLGDIIRQ